MGVAAVELRPQADLAEQPGDPVGERRAAGQAVAAERLPDDPAGVVATVAADRIAYGVQSGWPLLDLTVEFWNSLVEPFASR